MRFMLTPNRLLQVIVSTLFEKPGQDSIHEEKEKKHEKLPFCWILNGLESSDGHVDAVV